MDSPAESASISIMGGRAPAVGSSLRTGLADFPHPALQLMVLPARGLTRRHEGCGRLHRGAGVALVPLPVAAQAPPGPQWHLEIARLSRPVDRNDGTVDAEFRAQHRGRSTRHRQPRTRCLRRATATLPLPLIAAERRKNVAHGASRGNWSERFR